MLGLGLQTWLGLSVIGAIVSTLGALAGIIVRDFYFSRSFDTWRRKQDLAQTYQKFKDPLQIAAIELAARIDEIITHYPAVYLYSDVFNSQPERQLENNISDPYFQRSKLVSTIYRFNSFFGWLELYRQEITFLKGQTDLETEALERAISFIRIDLADGQINKHLNWKEWHDTLIFREELRAIGESMIEERGSVRTIMGYGKFHELVVSSEPGSTRRWAAVPMNFFLDPDLSRPDFRLARLKRVIVHLVDLIELLQPSAVTDNLKTARLRARNSAEAWTLEQSSGVAAFSSAGDFSALTM